MNFDMIIELIVRWTPATAILLTAFIFFLCYRYFFLNTGKVGSSHKGWTRQAVLTCILLTFFILILLNMPISENMKGQLFNLFGIAITATIALSSTTFVGNTMAGIMLKVINGIRPGDFIKVGESFGRVSEQGLLHTEIQTEDRDLTTLPNLYLVTTPVKVIRSSGTIVSATVSLGYNISRKKIGKLLIEAGEKAGLETPYVQILELGDYSVNYRIAGFLADVKYLISFRSKLREYMLDILHDNKIEIVSPTFMNQRVYSTKEEFVPEYFEGKVDNSQLKSPEDFIFDKAEEAQSVEKIREMIHNNEKHLKTKIADLDSDKENEGLKHQVKNLNRRQELLLKLLSEKEEQIS